MASINSDCFTIVKSIEVKISREIIRCQGYFYNIALEMGLGFVFCSVLFCLILAFFNVFFY